MPLEFGGKNRFPCPDDLFFSAIGGCILTTFLYFKNKIKLNLRDLRIVVQGKVNSVGAKGYRIMGIEVFINVETDEREKSKAEKCVELAKDYCHLTRSIEQGIPIKILYDVKI
jgi:uncharacterized OsmC-like protein